MSIFTYSWHVFLQPLPHIIDGPSWFLAYQAWIPYWSSGWQGFRFSTNHCHQSQK